MKKLKKVRYLRRTFFIRYGVLVDYEYFFSKSRTIYSTRDFGKRRKWGSPLMQRVAGSTVTNDRHHGARSVQNTYKSSDSSFESARIRYIICSS